MKRYKNIFTAVVIICLMSVIAEASILDQQQLEWSGSVAFWGDNPRVQTFTPSMTGKLAKVDLALAEYPSEFNEMVHVSIVEWNTDQPGTVLGVSDFYMDDFNTTAVNYIGPVDFSSQNVLLNAGIMYGIMLSNDLLKLSVSPYRSTGTARKGENPYAGGSEWFSRNWGESWTESTMSDLFFATYMVPEPASLLLLGLGGLALRFKRS